MPDSEFIVVYDTYCGWCYGAAPIFDALVAHGAKVKPLHRHLFQGPLAYRMSAGKGAQILKADARIQQLTGQEFSETYKANIVLSDSEVLASLYTAQAAALVHSYGPEKEFAVRRRLEKARYIDGVSAADRDSVVAALIAEGIPETVAEKIGTHELAAQAEATARIAKSLMEQVGAHGVPTVLKVTGNIITSIDHTAYYGQPEKIAELIS